MSIKQLTEVWISELKIFKWRKSLIFSQHLPKARASVIKVWLKPFDLAWDNLVLLSFVRSSVVSITTNQSSNCVESLPLKVGISWIIVLTKVVCFWAKHNVSVYYCSTSSRGPGEADGCSTIDNLWSLHSMHFRASMGWPSPAWTLWHKSSGF